MDIENKVQKILRENKPWNTSLYAMRKMNSADNKVTLTQKDKSRVVNNLVKNFKSDLK